MVAPDYSKDADAAERIAFSMVLEVSELAADYREWMRGVVAFRQGEQDKLIKLKGPEKIVRSCQDQLDRFIFAEHHGGEILDGISEQQEKMQALPLIQSVASRVKAEQRQQRDKARHLAVCEWQIRSLVLSWAVDEAMGTRPAFRDLEESVHESIHGEISINLRGKLNAMPELDVTTEFAN